MIGHAAVEPKPAEPSIRQIKVDLRAQAPLGAGAEAVAKISMRIIISGSTDC
jgi:hypothetical protein